MNYDVRGSIVMIHQVSILHGLSTLRGYFLSLLEIRENVINRTCEVIIIYVDKYRLLDFLYCYVDGNHS